MRGHVWGWHRNLFRAITLGWSADRVPRILLEYFEKVSAWLENDPLSADKEIQILGMSKGAEVALILASQHPLIKRVALWAPHLFLLSGDVVGCDVVFEDILQIILACIDHDPL